MTSNTIKIGIAIYAQQGPYGRPRNPHWVLVLHPTSFGAKDVKVYHIRNRNNAWLLCHEVRDLLGMGDLIGVLHITDVPGPPLASDCNTKSHGGVNSAAEESRETSQNTFEMEQLDAFIKRFPPTRNGDDPSKLFFWSCESYVIRALAHLNEECAFELPCKAEEMYEYTKKRIAALKASLSSANEIAVISYAE